MENYTMENYTIHKKLYSTNHLVYITYNGEVIGYTEGATYNGNSWKPLDDKIISASANSIIEKHKITNKKETK